MCVVLLLFEHVLIFSHSPCFVNIRLIFIMQYEYKKIDFKLREKEIVILLMFNINVYFYNGHL